MSLKYFFSKAFQIVSFLSVFVAVFYLKDFHHDKELLHVQISKANSLGFLFEAKAQTMKRDVFVKDVKNIFLFGEGLFERAPKILDEAGQDIVVRNYPFGKGFREHLSQGFFSKGEVLYYFKSFKDLKGSLTIIVPVEQKGRFSVTPHFFGKTEALGQIFYYSKRVTDVLSCHGWSLIFLVLLISFLFFLIRVFKILREKSNFLEDKESDFDQIMREHMNSFYCKDKNRSLLIDLCWKWIISFPDLLSLYLSSYTPLMKEDKQPYKASIFDLYEGEYKNLEEMFKKISLLLWEREDLSISVRCRGKVVISSFAHYLMTLFIFLLSFLEEEGAVEISVHKGRCLFKFYGDFSLMKEPYVSLLSDSLSRLNGSLKKESSCLTLSLPKDILPENEEKYEGTNVIPFSAK